MTAPIFRLVYTGWISFLILRLSSLSCLRTELADLWPLNSTIFLMGAFLSSHLWKDPTSPVCDLCDADYVGYTCRHLYQRIDEHKGSVIEKHVRDQHGGDSSDVSRRFKILRKCQSKFDCSIYKMLFIKELKPTLNTQSDYIRAKLFLWRRVFLYILFQNFIPLLSSLLYFSFYHLPFVTLSTYLHIFIAFIFSCVILLLIIMQNSIHLFLTWKWSQRDRNVIFFC